MTFSIYSKFSEGGFYITRNLPLAKAAECNDQCQECKYVFLTFHKNPILSWYMKPVLE